MGRTWQSVVASLALAVSLLVILLELRFFFEFGRFNIDEGMHLNAGRMIFSEGLLPFRDFPFSQGPGGPFFYGALGHLFEPTLFYGRLGSLVAGLVCFGAMLMLAFRAAGVTAALVVSLLLILEFPALWMFSQVRTEPVAVALAMLAVLAFLERRGSAFRAALPALLLVAATSFRITYAALLGAVLLVTAFEERGTPRRLAAILGMVSLAAALTVLPMLLAPGDSFFHIFVAQADRAERLGWSELPASARFWFFTQRETSYRALFALLPLPVLWMILNRLQRRSRHLADTFATLFAAATLLYVPHLWFRYGFFQYFEPVALLGIVAVGIAFASLVKAGSTPPAARVALGVWLLAAWSAGAVGLRDTLPVWTDPKAPTLGRLAPLRAEIEHALPNGCEMLTFETHLAVELGCRVTPGLEYSYFSFFPDLAGSEAERRGVLNREALLERLLSRPPEFVAFTREGSERMAGVPLQESHPLALPEMGRYRVWRELRIPIGPIITFWNDVTIYARDDVAVSRDSTRSGAPGVAPE
jgi:hypothetical protein